MRLLPVLALLVACGGPAPEPAGKVWYAYDYAPEFGDSFTFVDPALGETPPADSYIHLFVGNDEWEVRRGLDFDSGTSIGLWETSIESDVGLTVGGFLVMPDGFVEGDTFDNGTVAAIAERKVAIGTFSEVISIDLDAGPLAPEIAFVVGTGPVVLSVEGTTYEVVEYDTP